jgi:MSHA pilin protein MshD
MYMTKSLQRGFTLIELIIFIVIVSAGLAGILSVMNTVVKSSADPLVRKQAIAIAESVMEEIMLKAFADPDGSQAGEDMNNSATYDGVSDYDGKTQAVFKSLPPALASYEIRINVENAANFNGVEMKKVTVTVSKGEESIRLASYRARDELPVAP